MKMWWIILVSLILFVASALGVRSCLQNGWERALWGPYAGLPTTNHFTNPPVSTLSILSHGRLKVYEVVSQIGPVLLLRGEDGAVKWSRLLVPERRLENGEIQRAGIRLLNLDKLERSKNGYKVHFTCDWDWGGKEGGLIDLDSNYELEGFRISW